MPCGLELARWEPHGRVHSCKEFDVSRETTKVSGARGYGGQGSVVGGEIRGAQIVKRWWGAVKGFEAEERLDQVCLKND